MTKKPELPEALIFKMNGQEIIFRASHYEDVLYMNIIVGVTSVSLPFTSKHATQVMEWVSLLHRVATEKAKKKNEPSTGT